MIYEQTATVHKHKCSQAQ